MTVTVTAVTVIAVMATAVETLVAPMRALAQAPVRQVEVRVVAQTLVVVEPMLFQR